MKTVADVLREEECACLALLKNAARDAAATAALAALVSARDDGEAWSDRQVKDAVSLSIRIGDEFAKRACR